jgi:hypothetical protein
LRSAWQNAVTLAGAVLALLALLFFVSFQVVELFEPTHNPYTGLWSFLVLPAVLVIGLLLVPAGWLLERRLRQRHPSAVWPAPRLLRLDPTDPTHRKGLLIFGAGTLAVVPLIGLSTYKGYHYTESTQFCGQVCHSVMHPEHTSYLDSPHARVSCAACHIGPGADWYVKSKLSGVRQVLAVTFHTYSRPIPTPVENLRPARETCEQCHWPAKFFGAQLRTRAHFAADEANTRSEQRMLVKIGGGGASGTPASGIHWHMALSHVIEYVATDRARQVIPWVRATDASGRSSVYRSDGKRSTDPPPAGELRRVVCVDCHNRPTHSLLPPDRALDRSLETGRLDRTLPYVKRVGLEALTRSYSTEEEADRGIESVVRDHYRKLGGDFYELRKASVNQAVDEIRAVYHRNFFPRMKVDWRAYPDNIGHLIFDGCFRCHDGKHRTDDGRLVRKDCTVCHEFQLPAASDPSLLRMGTPEHPVKLEGKHGELSCSSCHTGGRAPVPTCVGCHTRQDRFVQGEHPVLPGVAKSASSMAGVDCDSCHDLSKPLTAANLAERCESCHEKGYGDMLQLWKDDAAAGRAKAAAALAALRGKLEAGGGRGSEAAKLSALLVELQTALDEIDRAGPLHNPPQAEALFQQIVKRAEQTGATAAN